MLSFRLMTLLKWVLVPHINIAAPFLELVLVGFLLFRLMMRKYANKIVIPVWKPGVKWPLKEDWGTSLLLTANTIPLMGHISTQSLVLSVTNTKKNSHVFTGSMKSWNHTFFIHALWNGPVFADMNIRTNIATDEHLIQSLPDWFSLWMSKLPPSF